MSLSGWREPASERIATYSPIGLRLVDDFTGGAPLGRVSVHLDVNVGAGSWKPTDIEAVLTSSNVFTWPGLGRARDPGHGPTRRYRARIESARYRAGYLKNADGLEFDAPPWDNETPPVPVTKGPQDLYLYPSTAYDFPTWVRVLHGVVMTFSKVPVANVLVHQGSAEAVLTDERGAFSLPLRWATSGLPVDALDMRNNKAGSHVLNLPADLGSSVAITIV